MQLVQQTLEPARVSTGFHAHPHGHGALAEFVDRQDAQLLLRLLLEADPTSQGTRESPEIPMVCSKSPP